MKIILSRKGFDSSSGGTPSPIFPDGRMVSFPIPDKHSPVRYADIKWHEFNIGSLVSNLTRGRILTSHFAHLDPDLNSNSIPRLPEWRPLLGQTGTPQGHLRNSGIQADDIFLFFGLFRDVVQVSGKYDWDSRSKPRHLLWGWLQIDEILKVSGCDLDKYKWARYHPHFHREVEPNNTVYVARDDLAIPGNETSGLAGAGVFPYYSDRLLLTATTSKTHSLWELPPWCHPRNGKYPLTFHTDSSRWQRTEQGTQLKTVGRGQEFVMDCDDYPEAYEWLRKILLGQ